MNTQIVNLQQTMTSLEIAELTGKQHKNVMQAIRNMEPAWEKVNGLKFQLVEYRDAKGELRPITRCHITRCQARCDTLIVNLQQTMTSLEIAELTGKQHKHVMEAIRKMEPAWVKTCGSNFRLTSRTIVQPNGGTREVPCYQLTKTECLYIATKFNDEARATSHGARHAVTGAIALVAVIGFIFFTYRDWKEAKHNSALSE